MYKLLSFIFVFSVSTTVYAKVTDADVDRDMHNLAAQNHFVTQGDIDNQWNWYNKPPNEVSTNKWKPLFRGCSNNFTLRNGVSHYQEVLVTGVGSLKAQTGSIIIPVNGRPTGKYVIPFDSNGRTNDYIYFVFASDHSV
ncbi:hypothetical protein, partial [Photobacterium damselae]